ncbi:MAG: gamma-glutamyltransferase family protein [Tissierellia bacterium]|nr:gamma-glutamyltransferase family protein [Tissierellia bacterium]
MNYPYPSQRNVVYGYRGMVATGNVLAAQAGLEMLKKGGNAIDAALATSLCLSVTECCSNGLGGDLFAIIYYKNQYFGINSHGPAPRLLSLEALKEKGFDHLPKSGPESVTVPGLIGGVAALQERFSKLSWEEIAAPAMAYATHGFALQPRMALMMNRAKERFEKDLPQAPTLSTWFSAFLQDRDCFKEGDLLKLPGHARALEELAKTKGKSFYHGTIADEIDAFMRKNGGFLRKEDLKVFKPQWVSPLYTDYKGHRVFELPPSGQGIGVLMALKILEKTGYSLHNSIEATKLSLSYMQRHLADEGAMVHPLSAFLEDFPEKAAGIIGQRALVPEETELFGDNTVYLCAADGEGNMISLIQSNYMGFGSGVVLPHWGIALQNRGCNFSNDPTSANSLAPGKRPYHTIIPGFIEKPGTFRGPFGVMGGFMQPQGQLQILMNMIEEGLNLQSAIDKPRWQWIKGRKLHLEEGFSKGELEELEKRGHEVEILQDPVSFGRAEIILRYESGLLEGACEPRTDAAVAVW